MLRSTGSKVIPLLTGNCSFQEQHKRRLFLVIFILFDGTAHILHLGPTYNIAMILSTIVSSEEMI